MTEYQGSLLLEEMPDAVDCQHQPIQQAEEAGLRPRSEDTTAARTRSKIVYGWILLLFLMRFAMVFGDLTQLF